MDDWNTVLPAVETVLSLASVQGRQAENNYAFIQFQTHSPCGNEVNILESFEIGFQPQSRTEIQF